MRRSRRVSFAAVCLLAISSARAAERTVASPDELNRALREAASGDVIVLANGEWKDLDLKVDFDATQDEPLTIRAETPGEVVLTGTSRARIGGSHVVLDGLFFKGGLMSQQHVIALRTSDDRPANNCRVTNCAVVNYKPSPDREGSTMYLSLYGTNNRVDHCYFRGKVDEGPMVVVWVEAEPNHHRIDHNHFAGRSPLGKNGGETLRVGTSTVSMNNSHTLVEHNLFTDCNGEAEYVSNKSCENVYRYNTFRSCKGALVLRHGNRCTIEGNWFFGNNVEGTGGVRIIGEDHRIFNNYLHGLAGRDFESAMPINNGIPNSKLNEYFRVQRVLVAFNTFVDCAQNITFGVGAGKRNRVESPVDMVFANNLVVGKRGPLVGFDDRPVNTTWIGNVVWGADPGVDTPGVKVADIALYDTPPLAYPDRQNIGDAAEGSFPFVTDDIEGRPRVEPKDVGCFEVTNSDVKPTRRPLTPREVGPNWRVPELPMPTTQPLSKD